MHARLTLIRLTDKISAHALPDYVLLLIQFLSFFFFFLLFIIYLFFFTIIIKSLQNLHKLIDKN